MRISGIGPASSSRVQRLRWLKDLHSVHVDTETSNDQPDSSGGVAEEPSETSEGKSLNDRTTQAFLQIRNSTSESTEQLALFPPEQLYERNPVKHNLQLIAQQEPLLKRMEKPTRKRPERPHDPKALQPLKRKTNHESFQKLRGEARFKRKGQHFDVRA